VGDVAVVMLGAGFAEFLAFAHEDHRHSPDVRQDFLIFQGGNCTGIGDSLDATACLLLAYLPLTFLAQRRADPDCPHEEPRHVIVKASFLCPVVSQS